MRKGIQGIIAGVIALTFFASCTDSEPVDFEITSAEIGDDGFATFKIVFNKTVEVDSAMVTSPEDSVQWLFSGQLTQDSETSYIAAWKDTLGNWYAPKGTYKIEAIGSVILQNILGTGEGDEFDITKDVTIE
jgi:hypothetical protein